MSEADFGRPNDSRPTIPSSTVSCRSSSTSELEAFNSILSVEQHIRTEGQAPMMVASSSNGKASHFTARFATLKVRSFIEQPRSPVRIKTLRIKPLPPTLILQSIQAICDFGPYNFRKSPSRSICDYTLQQVGNILQLSYRAMG